MDSFQLNYQYCSILDCLVHEIVCRSLLSNQFLLNFDLNIPITLFSKYQLHCVLDSDSGADETVFVKVINKESESSFISSSEMAKCSLVVFLTSDNNNNRMVCFRDRRTFFKFQISKSQQKKNSNKESHCL